MQTQMKTVARPAARVANVRVAAPISRRAVVRVAATATAEKSCCGSKPAHGRIYNFSAGPAILPVEVNQHINYVSKLFGRRRHVDRSSVDGAKVLYVGAPALTQWTTILQLRYCR